MARRLDVLDTFSLGEAAGIWRAVMNKWLPIDAAPEDEKIIIFATPDWVDTAFFILDEDYNRRDWFWSMGKRLHQNHVPTHWMPLPDPPEAA